MTTKKKDVGYVRFRQHDGTRMRIPFQDANREVTLVCTQEDIDLAVCGDPFNCVMARMYQRAFGPTCTEVRVGKTAMHVVMGMGDFIHSMRFNVKGRLKRAIDQFDRSRGASGFRAGEAYTLYPPTPSDRRNARPGRPWNRQGGKGTQKQLIERRAPCRPTRNIFCFIAQKPV
jgi:hypothetical protein